MPALRALTPQVIKIGGYVRNKEVFAKRRQRLAGPNGSSLAYFAKTNLEIVEKLRYFA